MCFVPNFVTVAYKCHKLIFCTYSFWFFNYNMFCMYSINFRLEFSLSFFLFNWIIVNNIDQHQGQPSVAVFALTYLSTLFFRKNDYKLKNVRFHTPNMHGNLLRTEQAFVQGTCCWKIYPRKGGIGQKLRPGMNVAPKNAYIARIKTTRCWTISLTSHHW